MIRSQAPLLLLFENQDTFEVLFLAICYLFEIISKINTNFCFDSRFLKKLYVWTLNKNVLHQDKIFAFIAIVSLPQRPLHKLIIIVQSFSLFIFHHIVNWHLWSQTAWKHFIGKETQKRYSQFLPFFRRAMWTSFSFKAAHQCQHALNRFLEFHRLPCFVAIFISFPESFASTCIKHNSIVAFFGECFESFVARLNNCFSSLYVFKLRYGLTQLVLVVSISVWSFENPWTISVLVIIQIVALLESERKRICAKEDMVVMYAYLGILPCIAYYGVCEKECCMKNFISSWLLVSFVVPI